jgi:uncharacterized membrane protein YozB (DUF420 family)
VPAVKYKELSSKESSETSVRIRERVVRAREVQIKRFAWLGWARPTYFAPLGTHTLLAVAVPPLAIITLVLALKRNFTKHPKIARWTYPIWLYVSLTGVLVYMMLYHFFPGA